MYKLNHLTRDYIKAKVGLSFKRITRMDSSDLDNRIETKIKKKLEHKPPVNDNLISRGSPYLFRWRLENLNKIDKLLGKI